MELFDCNEITDTASEKAALAAIDKALEKLGDISPNARDNALHALLYGFSENSPASPPLPAIKSFVQKVLAAAEKAGDLATEEARRLAEQACNDRLDPDTEQVKTAAFKVTREFDRLRGLLRFKPEPVNETQPPYNNALCNGGLSVCYIARCAPDHFVLPLLADHFWRRFGKQSWAIIDEKRNLVLSGKNGGEPVLRQAVPPEKNAVSQNSDEWEKLWKNYHHSVNNPSRANPKLQKQFMPVRYWKYLTEKPD